MHIDNNHNFRVNQMIYADMKIDGIRPVQSVIGSDVACDVLTYRVRRPQARPMHDVIRCAHDSVSL
jgi:hypothetical protein